MASIEGTITTSLRNSGQLDYLSYARPVIAALEDREREISRQLIEYAVDRAGMDEDTVLSYLAGVGMEVSSRGVTPEMPADPFVDQPLTGQHLAETLTRLAQQVDQLTAFARRNGFRG
jgi:hypothetical protein